VTVLISAPCDTIAGTFLLADSNKSGGLNLKSTLRPPIVHFSQTRFRTNDPVLFPHAGAVPAGATRQGQRRSVSKST